LEVGEANGKPQLFTSLSSLKLSSNEKRGSFKYLITVKLGMRGKGLKAANIE
jgi:hypothetical protein